MKEQIRQISKTTILLTAVLLITSALIPVQATGQTYYLMFEVTVKGKGESDGVVWSVDRTYASSGMIVLKRQGPLLRPGMSPEEGKKEMEGGGDPKNRIASGFPLRVTIKDYFESVNVSPCPAVNGKDAFEETTFVKETWEGSAVLPTKAITGIKRFRVRAANSSEAYYNVYIPVFAPEGVSATPLVYINETAITRKAKTRIIENRSYSTVQVPIVDGILEYPAIHHEKDPVLNIALNEIDYDHSYVPSEPVIKNIPNSKKNSVVRIRYRFSSSPFDVLPDTKK